MDIKMVPKIDLLYLTRKEHFPYDISSILVNGKLIYGVWQGLLVCKKKNKILKKCIDNILYVVNNNMKRGCLGTTGPLLLAETLYKSNLNLYKSQILRFKKGKVYNINNVILYQYSTYRQELKSYNHKSYGELYINNIIYQNITGFNYNITHYKIYGERCSGTNYLNKLIEQNFFLKELKDKKEYNVCRHFFNKNINFNKSDHVIFICIVRDLKDWLNSLYKHKHNIKNKEIFNDKITFLNNKLDTEYHDIHNKLVKDINVDTNKLYSNVFELNHEKNTFLKNILPTKVKHHIIIQYEDLLYDFKNTMTNLLKKGLIMKDTLNFPKNISSYVNAEGIMKGKFNVKNNNYITNKDIYNNENYKKYIMSHINNISIQKIAVIGNGKISDKDRENIKKCNLICRFNDAKNYKNNEKTDILFVRQHGHYGKIHGLDGYTSRKIITNEIVLVGSWISHLHNLKKYNNIPIHMIDIYEEHCSKYKKCTLKEYNYNLIFDNKTYKVPYTRCYLSSGTIGISYLLSRFPNAILEIFGMNWAFTHNGHPGYFEKKIIDSCKRCKVNKMETNIY